MDNNQKVISHYGVPGMRWGHRRNPKVSGNIKRDAKTVLKLHKKATVATLNSMRYYKNDKSRMQTNKIKAKIAGAKFNEFTKSIQSQKGKAYLDSVMNKVNENRYDIND